MGHPAVAGAPGGDPPQITRLENYEVAAEFPHGGHKRMLLNARALQGKDERPKLIMLAMEEMAEEGR